MRVTIFSYDTGQRNLSGLNVYRLCQIVLLKILNKSQSKSLSKPPKFPKEKKCFLEDFQATPICKSNV